MEQIYDITIQIVRYVLTGAVADLPEDTDYLKLYEFSRSHGIENIIYVGLKELKTPVPSEVMKLFEDSYMKQIMVENVQTLELEELADVFEAEGVDYALLKGSVIKFLYPMPDLRKLGDIDILIHEDEIDKVDKLMCSNGYICEETSKYHLLHLVYLKPPVMNIEIHKKLLRSTDRAIHLYDDVWKYLKPEKEGSHKYVMDNELFYTFIVAHARKHLYSSGGAGIRTITDMYLCKKNYEFDKERLNNYLRIARLEELERYLSEISSKWMGDEHTISAEAAVLENLIFTGGSFGNMDSTRMVNLNRSKKYKIKKILRLAFPEKSFMMKRYPFIKKRPYLTPIGWVMRIIDILIHKRDQFSEQLELHAGIGDGNDKMNKLMKAICD